MFCCPANKNRKILPINSHLVLQLYSKGTLRFVFQVLQRKFSPDSTLFAFLQIFLLLFLFTIQEEKFFAGANPSETYSSVSSVILNSSMYWKKCAENRYKIKIWAQLQSNTELQIAISAFVQLQVSKILFHPERTRHQAGRTRTQTPPSPNYVQKFWRWLQLTPTRLTFPDWRFWKRKVFLWIATKKLK